MISIERVVAVFVIHLTAKGAGIEVTFNPRQVEAQGMGAWLKHDCCALTLEVTGAKGKGRRSRWTPFGVRVG